MKKKKIVKITLITLGVISLGLLLNKNRKQAGIISNQQHTIDGMIREIKNLSYHLGKTTKNYE